MWQAHEYHISFSVGSSSGHSSLLPFLAFGVGAGLFANGFWNFRKLRLLQDTPRVAARSVSMGLVHVRGKAGGQFLLTSPVTSTPCYYYHVRLERWEEQGKSTGWKTVHSESDRRVFFIEDETGKVLVNPQSAEYDLPNTFCAAFGPHARGTPYLDPSLDPGAAPSEDQLRAYAAKTDPTFRQTHEALAQVAAKYPGSSLSRKIEQREQQVLESQNPLTGHGSYRLTERCVAAGHDYEVIGTCAQNPQSSDDQDQTLILKGRNESTFIISGLGEGRLEKQIRKRAITRIVLGGLLMVVMAGFLIANFAHP